ncbi:MAG: FAD-dependent oxidoreductase [Coriobacteriaceae bacterium]|nr:FAD-dependent oxidoreductase [Coriobacteriaceae bacterium]
MKQEEAKGKGISRRTFMSGAAVGAMTLIGLSGCSAAKKDEASADSGAKSEPVAPATMDEELDCDILVVGAGISGLAAAVQAAEDGNKVIVLEKGSTAGGNGLGTEGVFAVGSEQQQQLGIDIDPVDIIRTELSESQWRSNGAMWYDLVSRSAENLAWLQENGVLFSGVVDNYHVGLFPTMHWFDQNLGALSYVPQMQAAAEKNAAEFYFDTAAKSLIKAEDGSISGAFAEDFDGKVYRINAKAVVLASGGVGANPKLLAEIGWTQEKIDEMMVVCNPNVAGDGYKMAMDVGVKSFLQDAAIQAFQGVHAFGNDSTSPYNSPLNGGNGLCALGPCVWVDQDAKRFCDESLALVFNMAANATACLANRETYAIFDQTFVESCALEPEDQKILDAAVAGSNPDSVFSADNLDDLAEHFKLDVDTFKETLGRYNEFCETGKDGEFGKNASFMQKISSPPFYIAKVVNNLVVIDGGVTTNIRTEALDERLNPIPGLYAVGLDGAMLWRKVYTQNMPGTIMGNNVHSGRTAARNAKEYVASI